MQLRSNKFNKIMGLLRRPQTLKPVFHLDVDLAEYNKQHIKWKLYSYYSLAHLSINDKINSKDLNYFHHLNNFNKSGLDINQIDIIEKYKKLKASPLYDESICTIGLVTMAPEYYLGFYFPKIMLKEVNTNRKLIELRDMYFYLSGSSLKAFRTTLDINNPRFIHPHIAENFGTFCLGESPLKMSIDTLRFNFEDYNEDDADIFWINFYNTIFQKTEHGNHHYALDRLGEGNHITETNFENIIFSSKDFLSNVHKYIYVNILDTKIECSLNIEGLKKDYFELLSEDTNVKNDYSEAFQTNVKFNNKLIKHKKYTTIYKNSRIFYSNLDSLLNSFIKNYIPQSFINKVYDDYKEKTKQSNNSGEQSVGQNQVFEFQML